jgi:hypothetical protein
VLLEIIKELPQSEICNLLSEVKDCHDKGNIIESMNKAHCYQVCIYAEDFKTILINSSIENKNLPLSDYPTILEVIYSIKGNPDFLEKTNDCRRLDGKTVKQYFDEFKFNRNKPMSFFLVDRYFYPEMNPNGLFYVRDGMHHLVAYGLAVNMNEDAFPILGYYSTNDERV